MTTSLAEEQSAISGTHGPFQPMTNAPAEGAAAALNDPFNAMGPSSLYDGDDFTSFLDSISLPSHPFSVPYQPLPFFPVFTAGDHNNLHSPLDYVANVSSGKDSASANEAPTPSRSVLPRHGTHLPSLQPEGSSLQHNKARQPKDFVPVTAQYRDRIVASLRDYANVLPPNPSIPSRHALSRCVTGYFIGFQDHYPFMHIPTFSIDAMTLPLFLSMAALGARYCREPDTSNSLYQVAKVVTLEHIRRHFQSSKVTSQDDQNLLETVQSLLLLTSVSMWFEHNPPFQEALYIRSFLETLARQGGLNYLPDSDGSWESWIQRECVKRTKLIVFCFFNIQTIVFDLPPMILTEEIQLDLPCTEGEWQASNAALWQEERRQRKNEPKFQDALWSLFCRNPGGNEERGALESFTSLGGYVLIHAIIQNIWFMQKTCRMPGSRSQSLSPTEIVAFEQALERWCQCWERNQESSIDPMSPHGPLSFTSAALLRSAYIRLNVDFSSARQLKTWNPRQIAQSLRDNVCVQRSERLTHAALHCAHALSTPIKLGINFVAHTQVVLWSNQHALCSLECAVLLAKWLEVATAPGMYPGGLTEQEAKLLDFVIEMALETEHEASRDWLLENNTRLSATVTRLWARLFTADYIWEMVSLVGQSLNSYADILENESK
ncbi:hypothetical protein SI65_08631 [Aspergillus cristatus]|uniref:Xylanolytic transcriptional activator regulatory domain-containing protein n=1 Tax=Aspergillus cristatus TaxID=573508 RepID=A0A1E3B4Q3_ASPCR|nr:hypothetical protein SI65_08631 [Aspergillus cristatus]